MTVGMKFDHDKADYSLLPFGAMDEVVKVLTYGARKYNRNNWQHVDDVRYQAAAMRHFSAYMQGEQIDPESGVQHLAHMVCSVLFLIQKDLNKQTSVDNPSNTCYNSSINQTFTVTYKDLDNELNT